MIKPVNIYADSFVASRPFYFISQDETRIFFVTPSFCFWREPDDTWDDYPPTGLYYNTDPPTLIYLVENPCWRLVPVSFIFSYDLSHFAWIPVANMRYGDRHSKNMIVFYNNGIMTNAYNLRDVTAFPGFVPRSVSSLFWYDFTSITLNKRNNRLSITTAENVRYTFDISTGRIIRPTLTPRNIMFYMCGTVGGILVLVIQKKPEATQ